MRSCRGEGGLDGFGVPNDVVSDIEPESGRIPTDHREPRIGLHPFEVFDDVERHRHPLCEFVPRDTGFHAGTEQLLSQREVGRGLPDGALYDRVFGVDAEKFFEAGHCGSSPRFVLVQPLTVNERVASTAVAYLRSVRRVGLLS